MPGFIAEATRAVEAFEPGARVCAFGHLGDGNIHFNVSQPLGADKAAFLERWDAMNEVVHGGRRAHRRLVLRRARRRAAQARALARTKDPAALAVMRAIKAALDPNGIMNPGKVL